MRKKIISLFDYTGQWAEPYRLNNYDVMQVDIKNGFDIMQFDYWAFKPGTVHGILAAPPCTDFAVSGAQYWPTKDETGATHKSVAMVLKTLLIISHIKPQWWVLENPIGRLPQLVPELKKHRMCDFDPCEFGEPYTKKTVLYGDFNPFFVRHHVPAMPVHKNKIMQVGGNTEKTKTIRSATPMGFAWAFYNANP